MSHTTSRANSADQAGNRRPVLIFVGLLIAIVLTFYGIRIAHRRLIPAHRHRARARGLREPVRRPSMVGVPAHDSWGAVLARRPAAAVAARSYQTLHPASTRTGTPRVRATQLPRQLRRGVLDCFQPACACGRLVDPYASRQEWIANVLYERHPHQDSRFGAD
jgi:hypothetical protein